MIPASHDVGSGWSCRYGGELSRRQTGGEHVGNLSVAEDRDLHGKDRLIAKRGGNQVRNRRAAGGEDLQMCLEMKAARQRCAPWHPAAHELLAAAVDQDDAGRAKDRGGRGDQLAEVFQITGLEARRLSQQLQGRLGVADVAIRGDDERLGPRVRGISEAIGRLLYSQHPEPGGKRGGGQGADQGQGDEPCPGAGAAPGCCGSGHKSN